MRNAFIRELMAQARRNPSLWLLTGDIGYSVLEEFAREFPERFLNVGVAEANMTGIAAGLAQSGKMVFTYTIGNFSFMRCMEQIRNDVCYHNLNVKIVAVGGGFAYGAMGYTHHAIEDIAMLRVLPNLTVAAPGDPVEVTAAAKALCEAPGPGYLRLGRGGEPCIHQAPPNFSLSRALVLATSRDATIITSAGTLDIAHAAAQRLQKEGCAAGLISMPVLNPFDVETLLAAARETSCLVTIEEHGRGGLGSLVAEALTTAGLHIPVRSLYVRKAPPPQVGDRAWLREYHGLTAEAILGAVRQMKERGGRAA